MNKETVHIYIWYEESITNAVAMTARYLGHKVWQIGSSLMIAKKDYEDIMNKTNAIPAALVTVEVTDESTDNEIG